MPIRIVDADGDTASLGSDASIDAFTSLSVLCWVNVDDIGATSVIVSKADSASAVGGSGWLLRHVDGALDTGHLDFYQQRATVDGNWVTPNDSMPGAAENGPSHVAVTYDNSDTANDPNIYIDGTLQAETETSTPIGAASSDAAQNFHAGGTTSDPTQINGAIGWLTYYNGILTAADVNVHRWWGFIPGGPDASDVWHPFVTEDTQNKGTATANAVLSGTEIAVHPVVMRPGCGGY